MIIESAHNDTVKWIRSLKQAKYRREHQAYVVTGRKLVDEALAAVQPELIVVSKTFADEHPVDGDVCVMADRVFDSLTEEGTPQGILAVLPMEDAGEIETGGMIVALEDVQDPVNVGAIIRSADAFGAAGVLLSSGCADVYGLKVLRGSMGSFFHLPVIRCNDFYDRLDGLKKQGATLIAGDLEGEKPGPCPARPVMVIGNEGNGISSMMREMCDVLWRIPMAGRAESLNASVAAGILLYIAQKA